MAALPNISPRNGTTAGEVRAAVGDAYLEAEKENEQSTEADDTADAGDIGYIGATVGDFGSLLNSNKIDNEVEKSGKSIQIDEIKMEKVLDKEALPLAIDEFDIDIPVLDASEVDKWLDQSVMDEVWAQIQAQKKSEAA